MILYRCDFCKDDADEDKTYEATFRKINEASLKAAQRRHFCVGCFNFLHTILKFDRQIILDAISKVKPEIEESKSQGKVGFQP